jgi:hypothetical protein
MDKSPGKMARMGTRVKSVLSVPRKNNRRALKGKALPRQQLIPHAKHLPGSPPSNLIVFYYN